MMARALARMPTSPATVTAVRSPEGEADAVSTSKQSQRLSLSKPSWIVKTQVKKTPSFPESCMKIGFVFHIRQKKRLGFVNSPALGQGDGERRRVAALSAVELAKWAVTIVVGKGEPTVCIWKCFQEESGPDGAGAVVGVDLVIAPAVLALENTDIQWVSASSIDRMIHINVETLLLCP